MRLLSAVVTVSLLSLPSAVWAQEQDEPPPPGLSEDDVEVFKRLSRPRGGYARVLLTAVGGRGFRFNNPYRLRTQLGDSAESVSATAPYVDGGLALAFGAPSGLQHGAALHLSIALEGVSQQAVSLSYLILYRGESPFMGYGRLGSSLLTQPDVNVGPELAVGGAYFVTGGLGIAAELVGNLFYGAGTYEVRYTTIPVLSMQAGLIVDWEVLP